MDIRFFDSLESTNQYCKLLDPDAVGEFTVICARSQTAGIGQQGNVWVSEPGMNLTFSLILKPDFLDAADQYQLTMMLAVATANLVAARQPDSSVAIKWPNDIYAGNGCHATGKICGILTTNQIKKCRVAQSICGIGLNVNQTVFPDWVPNPVSLKLLAGDDFVTDEVLGELLQSIEREYQTLKDNPADIRHRYMQRLYQLGSEASYRLHGSDIRATITDVDRFGHLLLRTADGRPLSCDIKEIQFL